MSEVTETPAQELDRDDIPEFTVRMRVPHEKQKLFIDSPKKRKIIRAGRRGGKTTASAQIAVKAFLRGVARLADTGLADYGRVLYAVPTADQVTRFWAEVKWMLAEPIEQGIVRKYEGERIIELPGTPFRIRGKTAWNADTLRGDYCDLLILDEWQLMNETTWTEVGTPMLVDNNGDAVFIYTPPSLRKGGGVSKAEDPMHAKKMYDAALKDPRWLAVHFTSHDNPYLSRAGLSEVTSDMTDLAYRQEILAEDIDEIPGALWTRALIDRQRLAVCPPLKRIVVAVDPSGSTTNEAGVGAAGLDFQDNLVVIEDASLLAPSPKAWGRAAVALYHRQKADMIVGERNYGGDMVQAIIVNEDETVPYKDVVATRGKIIRAEPIAARFEKGKAYIVGKWPELEEQMSTYVPGQKESPNRLDWCLAAGTLVTTSCGDKPIETIKSGDSVLTRFGFKRVIWSGLTRSNAPTVTVELSNGQRLTGTGSHPVFVHSKEFVPLDSLVWGDRLTECSDVKIFGFRASSLAVSLIQKTNHLLAIFLRRAAQVKTNCIAKFGNPFMALSLKGMTLITQITTGPITRFATSSALPKSSTAKSTRLNFENSGVSTLAESGRLPVDGINLELDGNGIVGCRDKYGKTVFLSIKAIAKSAISRLEGLSRRSDSVVGRVLGALRTAKIGILSLLFAQSVAQNLSKRSIGSARKRVPLTVVRSYASAIQPVFNLSVADSPEFFANGVLVHNCVWACTALLSQRMAFSDQWSDDLLYDDATRPRDLLLPGGYQTRYLVLHYGASRPTVFLDILDDGDTLWVEREFFFDPVVKLQMRSDPEFAQDLVEFKSSTQDPLVLLPPKCESFQQAVRDAGIWGMELDEEKTDLHVRDAIRNVGRMMASKRIRFNANCLNTIRQVQSYMWIQADSDQTDKPIERGSECCIALRQLIQTRIPSWRYAA